MRILKVLAGTLVGGSLLTGCVTQSDKTMRKNQEYVKNSGISIVDYEKLDSSINKKVTEGLSNESVLSLDNWNSAYYTGWQEAKDSVYWSNRMLKEIEAAKKAGIELGKQAAIDSLLRAGKLIK